MTRPMTMAERFWKRVEQGPGCWRWTGYRQTNGYGRCPNGERGRGLAAHRVSWELHNGPIPEGLHVCHHCDNPPCVNPAHLFLGTDADNHADAAAKGRTSSPPHPSGDAHYRVLISDADALRLLVERKAGTPVRELANRYGLTENHVWRLVYGHRKVLRERAA